MSDLDSSLPRAHGTEVKTFRARAWIRKAMVGSAVLTVVFALGLTAFSIYSLIEFERPVLSMVTGFLSAELAVALVLVAAAVYWARYWTEYRIVLNDESIAREGLPHLVDRKKRIPYVDIARVTHGMRNVLKIIPKEGDPLAVGLTGLDGEPLALLAALRERLPGDRFDPDLEASIFKGASPDRAGYIIGVGLILATAISIVGLSLRDRILERTAWHEIPGLEGDLRLEHVDTATDGSVWVLAEENSAGANDKILLIHLLPDGTTDTVGFSTSSAVREALDKALREGPFPIDSLALDSRNRPWVIIKETPGVFYFDEGAWSHLQAESGGPRFPITDLVRAGDYLWARMPESNALFRIDIKKSETAEMGPLSWEHEGEAIEFRPTKLRGSVGGGAVLLGEFSVGGHGLMALANDGSIGFTTPLIGAPSTPTWRARSATLDGEGRIHTVLTSRDVCVEGRRLIKVGVAQADTPWQWRDIVYPADCGADPVFDEIQVDHAGRVWIKPIDGGVLVFPGPSGDPIEEGVEPLATYSRDNSGFNDGSLVVAANGLVLGVNEWGPGLVALDARESALPMPLPGPIAWLLERPYILQLVVVLLMLPVLIANNRRNFKR